MDLMRRIALAALAGAALAAAPAVAATPSSADPPAGAGNPPVPTGTVPVPAPAPKAFYTDLSNRTTFTRWAYTNLPDKVRSSPSNKGRVVGKLHFNTEDGPPEIYLALRQYTDTNGNQWVLTQLPGRPNGRTGWVPRDGLGEFHLIHTQLVVNRKTLRAILYKNGKVIFRAPVGVGKASTPTPAGQFWIREKLKGFGPVYGPLAFGTADYSNTLTDWPGGGVVGVHGTDQPNLVPGRPSHGCVRMHNKDILHLARLMPLGTPLLIV
jgi:lipoprotein-anchoring transpeptidase ErfK/SrfK